VGWGKGNILFGGAFRFAKYGLRRQRKKRKRKREGGAEFPPQTPLPPRPKNKIGVAKRFRRPAVSGTSKQNNFQFLLRKIWRAGVKKLKENCFALLAEIRRAETRSGAIRAFSVQKRFELRSAIATILRQGFGMASHIVS